MFRKYNSVLIVGLSLFLVYLLFSFVFSRKRLSKQRLGHLSQGSDLDYTVGGVPIYKQLTFTELANLSAKMYNAQGYLNDDETSEIEVLNYLQLKQNPVQALNELAAFYFDKYGRDLRNDFYNSLSSSELSNYRNLLP